MPSPSPTRVALVTGGAGNLGRAVVRRFLRDGAEVYVPAFDEREAALLRSTLEGEADRVVIVPEADLTAPHHVDRVIRAVRSGGGHGPDILLNLAGGFAMSPIHETDPEVWDRMWRMNATTAFLCSRAVFPEMIERRWGRIVNVSAFPALERGNASLSAYGAAKAAVLNLAHTLAREGAPYGITANAVLPSIIDTPDNRRAMPDVDTSTWLPVNEIAEVLAFLASDGARIVNGAAIPLTLSG